MERRQTTRTLRHRKQFLFVLLCFLTCVTISLCVTYVLLYYEIVMPPLLAGPVQKLTVDEITNELGGIHYHESCFVPKAMIKQNLCAPQFIIAGTMKGGTTSLFSYLQHHPLVLPLKQSQVNLPRGKNNKRLRILALGDKEIRFFNRHSYNPVAEQYSSDTITAAYMSFFQEIHADTKHEINYKSGYITGEASPTYLAESGVATRLHSYLPAVKLIFLLRNPIDRAYSEYWFRQGYIVTKEQNKFKYNSLGYTDEEIFVNCFEQDFQVMKYCNLTQWKFSDPWVGSEQEKCYSKTTRIMHKEQREPPLEAPQICGNPSSPLTTYCLTPEFFGYCNTKSAMLGAYIFQLQEWISLYPSSLMRVYNSENLFEDPISVLEDVEEFLGIGNVGMNWENVAGQVFNMANLDSLSGKDTNVVSSQQERGFVIGHFNESSSYPELSAPARNYLETKFKFYDRRLRAVLKKYFPSWTNHKNKKL